MFFVWQVEGDFNPRSPHGERQTPSALLVWYKLISIHAPRTGSDIIGTINYKKSIYFNPRSPHGERPAMFLLLTGKLLNFNPRSPHGERPRACSPL